MAYHDRDYTSNLQKKKLIIVTNLNSEVEHKYLGVKLTSLLHFSGVKFEQD